MTTTATETDLSLLFDWTIPCEYQSAEMCRNEDTHAADWSLRTICPGCQLATTTLACDTFWQRIQLYIDIGPGVNCRECKTLYEKDMFRVEPLR